MRPEGRRPAARPVGAASFDPPSLLDLDFLGNVIRGQYLGVELAVFEYRYQQPPIPTRHARHTTVVCVRRPGLELPCFLLHPRRGWLDKPTTLSRAAQITFPSSPLFSRTYELGGYAEGLVRRAFTPAVRQVFEEHQDQLANHCVEGLGDTLLFYAAAGRMTSPPALELIAVAARVAHQLCAAERVHPS